LQTDDFRQTVKTKLRKGWRLLPLIALLAGTWHCGKRDVHVALTYVDVTSGSALPYLVPHPLDFFPVDSFGVQFRLPEPHSPDALAGQVLLGNTRRAIYLLLDRDEKERRFYTRLFIDLNRDRDFTNDGPPYTATPRFLPSRNRHYVEFDRVAIPYEWELEKGLTEEPFLGKIYFWYEKADKPAAARIVRESWREGVFSFGEKRARVILSDDDCNGIYDANDRWALLPEDSLEGDGRGDLRWYRSITRLGWLGDTAFEIVHVSPRGNEVTLRRREVQWTREEDFARDNPYAVETRRPRAAREVEWLQNYAQALKLARQFKKPVLVNFFVPWCGPCRVMEERTLGDAEVVDLTDQFIRLRIDGDRHSELIRKYRITSYPTFLILDTHGLEKTRIVGYQPASAFVAFLRDALGKK